MNKYEALTEALKRAAAAARAAVEANPEDGGTCNFDAPTISLPRWNFELTKSAARAAGMGYSAKPAKMGSVREESIMKNECRPAGQATIPYYDACSASRLDIGGLENEQEKLKSGNNETI